MSTADRYSPAPAAFAVAALLVALLVVEVLASFPITLLPSWGSCPLALVFLLQVRPVRATMSARTLGTFAVDEVVVGLGALCCEIVLDRC